jgi:hypothetical protein
LYRSRKTSEPKRLASSSKSKQNEPGGRQTFDAGLTTFSHAVRGKLPTVSDAPGLGSFVFHNLEKGRKGVDLMPIFEATVYLEITAENEAEARKILYAEMKAQSKRPKVYPSSYAVLPQRRV